MGHKQASIAEQLRDRIDALKLTPYRVAVDSGLSYPAIYRFYTGETSPSLSTAERIAAALGCRLELVPLSQQSRSRR